MSVGDIRTIKGQKVRIEGGPDPVGNLSVSLLRDDGEYLSVVPESSLDPERPTYRADTPHGQVTIDLPVDGNTEQRAVWSKAAADAVS